MSKHKSKRPAKTFWANISSWLLQLELTQSPKNFKTAIHQWYDAFLESDDADDKNTRLEVKMVRDEMLTLFDTLELYDASERMEQIELLMS